MSCYTPASNMSYCTINGSNDSESEKPRDFSLIDSSPDSLCSPLTPSLPPPLPQPRISKVRPIQEAVRRVDGLCTRREPQQGPSNPPNLQFYREIVDKLRRHLARSNDPNDQGGLALRQSRYNYSDENVLNQGGRDALNSHYERWTGDVTSRSAAKSATTGRRGPLHASVPLPARPSARRNETKVKTVVKYVEYDSYGCKNESKYIIKMKSGATSLRDFKRAMPHCVRQPRFFFSIGANENVELEDDNAKLPTITSEDGEPIIVAEITSRPL